MLRDCKVSVGHVPRPTVVDLVCSLCGYGHNRHIQIRVDRGAPRCCKRLIVRALQHDPFNLIQCDPFAPSVVELGDTGALIRRDLLRVLKQHAIPQVDRYAGCRND